MKKYCLEMILGAVLAAAFFAVWVWQSAGKLSQAELHHYIGILEKELPQEMEDRAEFIARLRAWGENDDGRPVFMLNLMRYHDQLKPFPGAPTSGTPAEVNAQYEAATTPMLIKRGGYPLVAGPTTRIRSGQNPESNLMVFNPDKDNWDRVVIVRYPGRRTFLDLLASPDYIKVMPYKLSSLEVVLTPVSGELVIPDLRWIVGGGCLAFFLVVGWVRAARCPRSCRITPSSCTTPSNV
jgi:uncharacterized protein (DUF1330 family)